MQLFIHMRLKIYFGLMRLLMVDIFYILDMVKERNGMRHYMDLITMNFFIKKMQEMSHGIEQHA